MASFQYRHPWIYELLIPLTHNRRVVKKFKKLVGQNVSVFDVAAGFGRMQRYIDSTCTYEGIDLNDDFLKYGRAKGVQLHKADIFDSKSYKERDVLTLVDVIHHLPEKKLSELFQIVFDHTKKRVVIMEPSFVNLREKWGVLGAPIDWFLKKMDNDGTNEIERWFTENEYIQMFEKKFGAKNGKDFKVKTYKVFPYYLAVFERK